DPELPQTLAGILEAHDLPASAIKIEITESTLMSDPPRAMAVLSRLRLMGVRLGIDDFGTGYSSLAYIKRLPVDELKIDQSFVTDMTEDENDLKIVRATVDLGHALGLKVIAEGVEHRAAWDKLRELGCDMAQGYFVSRPLPAEALVAWLNDWAPTQTTRRPAALAVRPG